MTEDKPMVALKWLESLAPAQEAVTKYHYLHQPVSGRNGPRGYRLSVDGVPGPAGYLIFGRPEATRCGDWYGGVADVRAGRCEVTRWQVINLARVWLSPAVQAGGEFYGPDYLPGYTDRRGVWRSTLASAAVGMALDRIGVDYLLARPPVALEEPYEITYCLSYCDTRRHKGTLYRASGFDLYRRNSEGIETYRKRLRGLLPGEEARVIAASLRDKRANEFRARGLQLALAV